MVLISKIFIYFLLNYKVSAVTFWNAPGSTVQIPLWTILRTFHILFSTPVVLYPEPDYWGEGGGLAAIVVQVYNFYN